jgi:outer membrane lipoprotein-sorting protein
MPRTSGKELAMPRKPLIKARWLSALVGVLLLTLTVYGCARKLTAEEIVARMRETMTSTNDAHGVVEVTAQVQGLSVQAVVEMWEKRPSKVRAKLLEAKPRRFAGTVIVTDGQTTWLYSPAKNQVDIVNTSDISAEMQTIIQGMDGLIRRVLDASDIELLGKEEVAGTKTYKLSLTPKEDEEQSLPVTGTATLWVDQKQWIVLKAHFVAPNLGEGTIHVRSLELNPGLADEVFAFEVPEGAQVVSAEDEKTKHMTLDEAEAQAGFDLLTPTYVPDGATLVDVMKVRDAFVLLYDLDGATFSVAQSQEELPEGLQGTGEAVTVRSAQATLVTDKVVRASLLTWQENAINFAVAGRIAADEAIKIAESLK